jgi:hypothetical protein
MSNILLRTAISALALAGAVSSLRADSVCVTSGSCNANWQPFVTPIHHTQTPGPDGPVYFDGFSYDAPDANIAYFIEGQGYFLGNPDSPDARLPFEGNPDGSAVTSFFFQSGGEPQIANFLLFQGLWAPFSSLGWYDADDPSVYGWILQPNGTLPQPQSVEFTPTDDFGLFFVPDSSTYDPTQTPAYYTDSTRNGIAPADVDYANMNGITLGPEAFQHFAVFQQADGGYYVGVNDRSNQVGDHDYNDMVFQLTPVPEPGSFGIAGAFALCLYAYGNRHRVRTAQRK